MQAIVQERYGGPEVLVSREIERPGIGDPSRHSQPRYRENSVYFNAVNANKRSIALDLTQQAGRAVVRRLLEDADVAIESYRPGGARKLGHSSHGEQWSLSADNCA